MSVLAEKGRILISVVIKLNVQPLADVRSQQRDKSKPYSTIWQISLNPRIVRVPV